MSPCVSPCLHVDMDMECLQCLHVDTDIVSPCLSMCVSMFMSCCHVNKDMECFDVFMWIHDTWNVSMWIWTWGVSTCGYTWTYFHVDYVCFHVEMDMQCIHVWIWTWNVSIYPIQIQLVSPCLHVDTDMECPCLCGYGHPMSPCGYGHSISPCEYSMECLCLNMANSVSMSPYRYGVSLCLHVDMDMECLHVSMYVECLHIGYWTKSVSMFPCGFGHGHHVSM